MHSIKINTLDQISATSIKRWVYMFIGLHVIVWTIVPSWVRYNLPMDALEGATWGHQLEWGYDKNPFMNGWLTELAFQIGGTSGWAIYFFSQLSVALCFWAIWQLGKKIMPPIYAFIAILLLESIQYYNLHAFDFDDNVLELGFWALTVLFFYQALCQQRCRDWLLTGLFAGCSMMIKYYAAMLLLPMLLFMLLYPKTRAQFKKPCLYLGLAVFFIFITPHIIWLFSHDFVTINYAFNRVSSPPHWLNHIYYPAQFAWQQFEVFFPSLVVLLFLLFPLISPANTHIRSFDKVFLFVVGVGPLALTLLLSLCTGIRLRAGWGQPLLSYTGLILLVLLTPTVTWIRFKRFIIATIVLAIGTIIIYCIALIRADEPSSANFPGKHIAATLENQWHTQFHTPLTYVVGARWLAGNIAFYSKDHPSVYIDADKKYSPWIDEEKLKQTGAIFVWDPTEERQMSFAAIKKRFAKLGNFRILYFPWMRNPKMKPVEISVAYLPPATSL